MFKSKKKRQQKAEAEAQALAASEIVLKKEKELKLDLLDDFQLAHDFRSSVIIPELNKDLDQQHHLSILNEVTSLAPPPPPIMTNISRASTQSILDGAKQYQDLAAWRHQRNQHRYSNGLFGGKQRDRPKMIKRHTQDQVPEQTMEYDFIEEEYEPDSDMEENFFFQDFSSDKPKPRKRMVRKRQPNKLTGGQFDLSSFAKDLHDHRLSVVQRESKVVMTEQDEVELQKLLELQRQRMSMMYPDLDNESIDSFQAVPPLPSLEHMKKVEEEEAQVPTMNSDHESIATSADSSQDSYPTEEDSNKIAVEEEQVVEVSQDYVTLKSPAEPIIVKPVASKSASSVQSTVSPLNMPNEVLQRSISTVSTKPNQRVPDKPQSRPSIEKDARKKNARKSTSMSDIYARLSEQSKPLPSAIWTTQPDTRLTKPIDSKPLYQEAPTKTSRSLFGSLRQVNRSKTMSQSSVNSFKGLVRNFSSRESHKSLPRESVGMSRAAMAVIQHNVAKHEQQKATSVILEEAEEGQQQEKRPKSDNGNRLVQLLARASSSTRNRKSNTTKVVNMDADESNKKRAQIVRKTIIYVQPDSLHQLLKANEMPPLPPLSSARNTMVSDGSLSPDDETVKSREYVMATKISRQTSVKKRIQQDNIVSRQGSTKKRYQLQSMDEGDMKKDNYMEGVELREMSDGTVVWGIVKKQGNRKSFYAPNLKHMAESKSLKNKANSITSFASPSTPPPPIPRRSPRRQDTTRKSESKAETDIYYSDKVTLPNLLKMMQGHDQYPGDMLDEGEEEVEFEEDTYTFDERAMASVDDQLDDFMR
ncbi:hypothetical protein CU098_002153, partial [Rhizopus stolonifer]